MVYGVRCVLCGVCCVVYGVRCAVCGVWLVAEVLPFVKTKIEARVLSTTNERYVCYCSTNINSGIIILILVLIAVFLRKKGGGKWQIVKEKIIQLVSSSPSS